MIRYHTTWGILCQIVMLFSLCFLACDREKHDFSDLSAFYYQLDDLPKGGITYTFTNTLDSLADPEIWHFQKSGPNQMESISYNSRHQIVLRQFDSFLPGGVLTDSLILYSADSSGNQQRIPVKVITPNRFPFNVLDTSKVWITQLDWHQPEDSLRLVLQRKRRFMGPATWNDHGRSVPAIKFRTEDIFETERDGWTTSSWSGEEIYAWHLGLVHYKRQFSNELRLEFELTTRKE